MMFFYCNECQTCYTNEVEHYYNVMSQHPHYHQIAKERSCYYYFLFCEGSVFNCNDHSVTCSKPYIFMCLFLLHPSCDYLARNFNIEVTIDCGVMVFCNGNDYSVTCSKLGVVYITGHLADRPEQDFSFFLFLLILSEKLIIDFSIDAYDVSFFIHVFLQLLHRPHLPLCLPPYTSQLLHYTLHQIRITPTRA